MTASAYAEVVEALSRAMAATLERPVLSVGILLLYGSALLWNLKRNRDDPADVVDDWRGEE